jgi:hypothetical protein
MHQIGKLAKLRRDIGEVEICKRGRASEDDEERRENYWNAGFRKAC